MSNEYFECPKTDGELLPVVDWDDREVGLATRREIHAQQLLHRAVHVIATDGVGRLLLQKRSMRKDSYPGWWDLSVGGHVGQGESYAEAAVREIAEEIGVPGADPLLVAILPPDLLSGWEHIRIFAARIDPSLARHDADEIDEVRWETVEDYASNASPYSPEMHWRIAPSANRSIRAWIEAGAPLSRDGAV